MKGHKDKSGKFHPHGKKHVPTNEFICMDCNHSFRMDNLMKNNPYAHQRAVKKSCNCSCHRVERR